ncbi:alkaline phosphatase D family protein [Alienimonas californiensis]|uniref:PhoD-like phosphatase n=1 Tax=Alienimonas californiensis TaxID=2527989 RepID=A0A517PCD5_9PLAN|nr:alkaline phosphatase D family protein [Alienimonas californiensis]QDT17022.1 PhoD-like phosphatase [Alienimonas californiensis]
MLAALLTCSLLAPPALALDLPMSGEVTATSALVQTRVKPGDHGSFVLTRVDEPEPMPAEGHPGPGHMLSWGQPATAGPDGIARLAFGGLPPGSSWSFRWEPHSGRPGPETAEPGRIGTFRTLPGPDSTKPVSFAVVTGLNYARWRDSDATEAEKKLGYPMLEAIQQLNPSFAVFTGDTVYYDTPVEGRAETREEMRAKWHENFVQPRFREFLAHVPVFHMKDDHDFRKDDADRTGNYAPSPELGIDVFREQVPVVPPGDDKSPTYRTVRCNKDLQLWFVEGRDYRSPNRMEDGPDKTIWGEEQYQWLTRTLKESDATFKVLVSPTPMVGPDDQRKRDNHTNVGGFRHERDRFFGFLEAEGMIDSGEFLIVCGDRHWQYHAEDPSGVHEFSSGAIQDGNSRAGRKAGDPQSTDPEGEIVQHYLMGRKSIISADGEGMEQYGAPPRGGYLFVRTGRGKWRGGDEEPRLHLIFNVSNESVPPEERSSLKSRAYEYYWFRKDGP